MTGESLAPCESKACRCRRARWRSRSCFCWPAAFSIILGFYARIGAALLLVFLVLATFFFHDFWTFADPTARSAQQIHFFKNVGLMGAMLMIIANDVGLWRMDSGLACSDAA
ncbi:MAG: hypothetical protein K1X71_07660 [Pirellulales bacterium]|nr:hypothetical protein [Pirellulales bacterium]